MKKIAGALALMLATIATPALAATTLYGMDSSGQLITINPATGATTAVGSAAGIPVGLARSSVTGTAYTRSFDTLYSINLATGASTAIGSSGTFLTGLAFNAAQTVLYSIDQGSGAFYSLDIATGAATLVGNSGISSVLDLASNAAGVIYGTSASNLYTFNTTTGAATLVSSTLPERLTAIEFDGGGDLYGVGIGTDALYRGLLATPANVGTLNPRYTDVRALEFVSTGAVPEPASWAMMIAGFGAVGFAMRRRRGNVTRVTFAAA